MRWFAGDDVLGNGLGGHSEKKIMRKALYAGMALAFAVTAVTPAMAGSYPSYGKHDNDYGRYGKHDSDYGRYGKHDNDYGRYGKHDNDYGRYGKRDNDYSRYGNKDYGKNYGKVRVAE